MLAPLLLDALDQDPEGSRSTPDILTTDRCEPDRVQKQGQRSKPVVFPVKQFSPLGLDELVPVGPFSQTGPHPPNNGSAVTTGEFWTSRASNRLRGTTPSRLTPAV